MQVLDLRGRVAESEALALAGVGLLPERATVVASGGLVVLALLGAAGLAQLTVAVRRLS